MRKIVLALFFSVPLAAQVSNPSIISVTVAPSGACTAGLPNQQVVSTGTQYSCQNGTWGAIGGGSGSGTVNSGSAGQITYYPANGTAVSGSSAQIVNCTGTASTDHALVQNALNVGGRIILTGNCANSTAAGGHWLISSNTTLDRYQATFTCTYTSADWCFINQGAAAIHAAQRTFTDAVLNGTTTVTSATAAFTSADVGQSIACTLGDGTVDLHTDIASVTNGTTVILTDAPTASGSGKTCSIWTRDQNITILGGTDIMAGTVPVSSSHELIRLETVNHAVMQDVHTVEGAAGGLWSVLVEDAFDVNVSRENAISNQTFQDGFHLQGPAHDVYVYQTHCNTGDDCIAISNGDSTASVSSDHTMYGAVRGVHIDGVEGTGISGVRPYVDLVSSPKNVSEVSIRHIHGMEPTGFQYGVAATSFFSGFSAVVTNVNIDDVYGTFTTNGVFCTSAAQTLLLSRLGTIGGANPVSSACGVTYSSTGEEDGTTSLPGIPFRNAMGTGWSRSSVTGSMSASIAGTPYVGINTTGLYEAGTNIGAYLAATYGSSPDVSIVRAAADSINFGNGTASDTSATINAGTVNSTTGTNSAFTNGGIFRCPNLSTGRYCQLRLGVAGSTNNDYAWQFLYAGAGSADNRIILTAFGASNLWQIDTKGFTAGAASTAVASGSTIAPTAPFFHVTGTTTINTITAPTICTVASTMCQITIIPDGLWSTGTSGNIAIASTAVVSKALIMTYDPGATKWYPSY